MARKDAKHKTEEMPAMQVPDAPDTPECEPAEAPKWKTQITRKSVQDWIVSQSSAEESPFDDMEPIEGGYLQGKTRDGQVYWIYVSKPRDLNKPADRMQEVE